MASEGKRSKVILEEAEAEFKELEATLSAFDLQREFVIKRSRDVQKNAKNAIYALQRNDMEKANLLLNQSETVARNELLPVVEKNPDLRYGAFANALEEYAEALLFRHYIVEFDSVTPLGFKRFPFPVTADEYLGGKMDCTGEVQRRAVLEATKANLMEVQRARNFINFCLEQTMLFEFRNGNLRKKSDSIKWCLKRVEEILLDMSLQRRVSESVEPSIQE